MIFHFSNPTIINLDTHTYDYSLKKNEDSLNLLASSENIQKVTYFQKMEYEQSHLFYTLNLNYCLQYISLIPIIRIVVSANSLD